MVRLDRLSEMRLRLSHYVGKQLWFIVFIACTGIALIYFLSSTGILDAMRDDNTLETLYNDQGKLPQAPYKKFAKVGIPRGGSSNVDGMTTVADMPISSAQERRLQQLNYIASLVRQDIKQSFPNSGFKSISATNSVKSDQKPLIPHIIHQTWDSHDIPKSFVKGIRSIVEKHPKWQYWFWTPRAVECFLNRHYTQYAVLFNAYPDATSKADALRYFVLHKFGGFYIDIDTQCLKPLDMWTHKFCCLLTEEPYEHSYIVRETNVSNIVNSPMGCLPNHPLFESAIENLPESAATYFGDYIQSTGPVFLERVYEQFIFNQSSLRNHSLHNQPNCPITLTPPKYFLPRFDPNQSEIIDKRCDQRNYKQLPAKQQRVCERLIKKFYKNEVDEDSYMDHSWIHVNMLGDKWKVTNTVPLKEIVPSAIDMELRFCS